MQVWDAKEVDGTSEGEHVGAGEQVKVRISGQRNTLKNNQGPGDLKIGSRVLWSEAIWSKTIWPTHLWPRYLVKKSR